MSRPSITPPPRSFAHCPLALHQLGADGAVGCHGADRGRHLVAANLGRRVDAVDQHAVLADLEGADRRASSATLSRSAVSMPRRIAAKRDGAVHRPGVEVLQTEARRERPRHSALAGSGRTVDGNDSHLPARPLRQALAVAGGALHADDGALVELGDRRRARRTCTPNGPRQRSRR